MPVRKKIPIVVPPRRAIRYLKILSVVAMLAVVMLGVTIVATHFIVRDADEPTVVGRVTHIDQVDAVPAIPEPFPLGVDPNTKTITENAEVDAFLNSTYDTQSLARRTNTGWFGRVLATLTRSAIYQNIASPAGRILVIQSGERKEEIANNFAHILKWDTAMKEHFLASVINAEPPIPEGKFMPSTYVTDRYATSTEVASLINGRFESDVRARYPVSIEEKVPLAHTLVIASLLEREAYDFEDMRYISGIIWNRLFVDMNLQIDATLQYAKGSKSSSAWWPQVVPADKYIASTYNTYKHEGLPPAPIANPSLDAILAALNPRKTDCIYYFHDRNAEFHCSVTYEEHVKSLKQYYGQGK